MKISIQRRLREPGLLCSKPRKKPCKLLVSCTQTSSVKFYKDVGHLKTGQKYDESRFTLHRRMAGEEFSDYCVINMEVVG